MHYTHGDEPTEHLHLRQMPKQYGIKNPISRNTNHPIYCLPEAHALDLEESKSGREMARNVRKNTEY